MDEKQNINFNIQDDDDDEIDLLEIFFVLRRHIAVIVAVAILFGAAAFAFTYFVIPPKYTATAQLYIVSASNESVVNLSDLQIATNLTADYKQLILSRPLMESVIKNLKLGDKYTPTSLADSIKITNPSGTRILHIDATSLDPVLSADIANEVAKLSVDWLPAIMESNKPNLIQGAIVPTGKSSPSYKKNTAIGVAAGLVLTCGIYIIQYLLDDTIKSADDMEKYFGVVPFASIPEDPDANDGRSDLDKKGRPIKRKKRGGHKHNK